MISIAHIAALLMTVSQPAIAPAQTESAWPQEVRGEVTLRSPGRVRYHIGYANIGFDHSRSDITLSWVDDGARTQTLFSGIHDLPPASLRVRGNRLILSMGYCPRDDGQCHHAQLRYRYDAQAKQFVPLNAAARAAPVL